MRSKEAILKSLEIHMKTESCSNCEYENLCEDGASGELEIYNDVLKLLESEHNKGMEEGWELARKIDGYSCEELADIFGDQAVHDENFGTVHEAKAKIDAWEEAKRIGNKGWIPCGDRLPDTDGEYLIQTEVGTLNILYYAGGWNCSRDYHGNVSRAHEIKDVVAWRPLPVLYRGK